MVDRKLRYGRSHDREILVAYQSLQAEALKIQTPGRRSRGYLPTVYRTAIIHIGRKVAFT